VISSVIFLYFFLFFLFLSIEKESAFFALMKTTLSWRDQELVGVGAKIGQEHWKSQ